MSTITYVTPLQGLRVDPQLGIRTGSADCAFRVAQGIIRLLTGDTETIRDLLAAINVPSGGIDLLQQKALFAKFGVEARFTNDVGEVRAGLAAGYPLAVAVQYGTVNDLYFDELSGDPDFRGGHNVGVYGTEITTSNGAYWHYWCDPLNDGRRAKAIAKQVRMVKRPWLEKCMAAMPNGTQALVCRKAAA